MKKALAAAVTFSGVVVFACLIAWLGGYDFDHRGPDIAFAASMTLIISTTAAFAAWELSP